MTRAIGWTVPRARRRRRSSGHLSRDERGFMVSLIMFFLAAMFAIAFAAFVPDLVKGIARDWQLAPAHVMVPLFTTNSGNPFMVPTSAIPENESTALIDTVQSVMGNSYGLFQFLSLIGLAVAFVMIGFSFILEQFNIIQEGTAYRTISESIFTIVLIFAFPLIFNIVAMVLNGMNSYVCTVTASNGNVVGLTGISETLVGTAGNIHLIEGWMIGDIVSIIGKLLFSSLVLMSVISAALSGIMRIVLIGALASIFPLMLVIRLIPFMRRVANIVFESLFGLVFVSMLSAIMFRFAFVLIDSPQLTYTLKWGISMAFLSIIGMLVTTLAPALGKMIMRAGQNVGTAVAGSMIATAQLFARPVMGGIGGVAAPTGEKVSGRWLLKKGAGFATGALGGLTAGGMPSTSTFLPGGVIPAVPSGYGVTKEIWAGRVGRAFAGFDRSVAYRELVEGIRDGMFGSKSNWSKLKMDRALSAIRDKNDFDLLQKNIASMSSDDRRFAALDFMARKHGDLFKGNITDSSLKLSGHDKSQMKLHEAALKGDYGVAKQHALLVVSNQKEEYLREIAKAKAAKAEALDTLRKLFKVKSEEAEKAKAAARAKLEWAKEEIKRIEEVKAQRIAAWHAALHMADSYAKGKSPKVEDFLK